MGLTILRNSLLLRRQNGNGNKNAPTRKRGNIDTDTITTRGTIEMVRRTAAVTEIATGIGKEIMGKRETATGTTGHATTMRMRRATDTNVLDIPKTPTETPIERIDTGIAAERTRGKKSPISSLLPIPRRSFRCPMRKRLATRANLLLVIHG